LAVDFEEGFLDAAVPDETVAPEVFDKFLVGVA